jgi:hypothetical protein
VRKKRSITVYQFRKMLKHMPKGVLLRVYEDGKSLHFVFRYKDVEKTQMEIQRMNEALFRKIGMSATKTLISRMTDTPDRQQLL